MNERLHELIPGGAHTYAKGNDQFPEKYYPVLVKGEGCNVWDADGNKYIEYGMGLRSVTLGHAYKPVVAAAYKQMLLGSNFGCSTTIELETAEKFLELMPEMDMVKFAKNGSDANNAAIKLARAYTGRDMVAICTDHPFFSTADWFMGSTAINAGIPKAIQELTVSFQYNNLNSVEQLFERYPGKIACLILEPEKTIAPEENFLHRLKELCNAYGAVLIFDEIITGFRLYLGGAKQRYGVTPDLCSFGKALGNGFSVAALAGSRELMDLGGLRHKKERVFLLSTTYGAEYHSLAAAIATMKVYREENVIDVLFKQGERLASGLQKSIAELRLEEKFGLLGPYSNLVYFTRDEKGHSSQSYRTLFLQETMRRGLILPSLIVSYSHRDSDIDQTIEIIHEALTIYRKALDEGIDKYLEGRSVQPVYRKYN